MIIKELRFDTENILEIHTSKDALCFQDKYIPCTNIWLENDKEELKGELIGRSIVSFYETSVNNWTTFYHLRTDRGDVCLRFVTDEDCLYGAVVKHYRRKKWFWER